jgi:hypothetical protein
MIMVNLAFDMDLMALYTPYPKNSLYHISYLLKHYDYTIQALSMIMKGPTIESK